MKELQTGTAKRYALATRETLLGLAGQRDELKANWDELKEYVEKFPAVWLKMKTIEEKV